MKLIHIYLKILFFPKILSSSIVVLPFEVNQINFSNKKYSSTEFINLLFKTELYTPIQLGSNNQKYFGIISLDDHHSILSENNCKKMNLFEKNINIIKKGYLISESTTCKLIGNITDYLKSIDFGQIYHEQFSYFNTTLIEESQNNNSEITELELIKDNYTESTNPEMCLNIGMGEPTKIYSNPSPIHFIDFIYNKRKIKSGDWTFKFMDKNNGLLIIGNTPHDYEVDDVKYSEKNYSRCNTENYARYLRPWAIKMKDIYFYNSTKDKIVVNLNDNRFSLAHNYGLIIGSNKYKELIYENYFKNLIDKKICELEISNKTIYDRKNYFFDTDGSFSMFICNKEQFNNEIKNFPNLYFSHVHYNYTFELTYKDLFMSIDNYYYFMILFPNNQTDLVHTQEEWYMGLPFLRKYQFVFNFDSHTIGFYRTKNFDDNENETPYQEGEGSNGISKVWIYIIQILAVIILVAIGVFVGMYIKRQRKKRANELTDDDYEYTEENINKNKLIN